MIKRNSKGQFVKGYKMPKRWCENLRLSRLGKGRTSGSFKKGEKPWNFVGNTQQSGYILIYKPNHGKQWGKSIYVTRAVLVMEEKLNRKLIQQEVVHHINNNKQDDKPKNLYLFSSKRAHLDYEGKVNKTYRKWIQLEFNFSQQWRLCNQG